MQERETIITGVMPPKKRKFAPKIVGAILLCGIVGVAAYFAISGKADGFEKKTLAIAAQSWHEVLGMTGESPIVAEVDMSPDGPIADDSSSTVDVGRNLSSSSAATPASPSGRRKATKKNSKDQGGDFLAAGVADAAGTPELTANDSVQTSSASLDDVAITDPIAVADDGADSSSSFAASSGDGSSASSSDGDSGATSGSPATDPSGKPPQCSFSGIATSTASPRVMLNEVAWMGSPRTAGETAAKAANREWIELANATESAINLDGWQVADSAGNIDAAFGSGDEIAPGGFLLLSRDGDPVRDILSDKAYSGGLPNAGDTLAVFDAGCGVSDVLDASAGWPGGDNGTKQTLERKVGGSGWQTSLLPGGTPRAENSVGAPQDASGNASSSPAYPVEVAIAGDGAGKVMSEPAGISCKAASASACTASYVSGTVITLTATPGSDATFVGWTGPCSGTGTCSFSVGGMVSVGAQFHTTLSAVVDTASGATPASSLEESSQVIQPAGGNGSSSTDASVAASQSSSSLSTSESTSEEAISSSSPSVPAAPAASPTHVVIAEVQIAGASSSNDFVKLYNPTSAAVDMSGWKLRKKSSTGADYSLRDLPTGTAVASGAYFTWANSTNGFAQSVGADVSSTETLAAENSVAIMDETGAVVDAVAWGTGTNQYGEGPPFPTDPAASQILARKSSGGVMVDTDDNAEDFALQ